MSLRNTLHNKEWLQARLEEGLSGEQIAALAPCSPAAVSKSIRALGLKSSRTILGEKLNDRDLLERLYITECRNAAQVSEVLNCDKTNVLKALRRHGIPVKDASEAQKVRTSDHGSSAPRPRREFVETLHDPAWLKARIAEGLNISEMSRLAHCSPYSVQQALEKAGIAYSPAPSPIPTLLDPSVYRGRRRFVNSKQSHYHEARRITPASDCALCVMPGTDVNHKDRNPYNNDAANLERLCRRHHLRQHAAENAVMWAMLRDRGIQYIEIHRQGRAALLAGIMADQKEAAAKAGLKEPMIKMDDQMDFLDHGSSAEVSDADSEALEEQIRLASDDPDFSVVSGDS